MIALTLKKTGSIAALAASAVVILGSPHPSAQYSANAPLPVVAIRPTDHPPLPVDPLLVWMTPTAAHTTRTAARNAFITGVKLQDAGSSTKALPVLSQPLLQGDPLSDYVHYYKGLAELSVGRTADARRTFQALNAKARAGYLNEAAALREAESNEALGDHAAALAIYDRLSQVRTTAPDDVLMRMGRAAEAVGDIEAAVRAYSLVYFDFPFSDLSGVASLALDRIPNRPPLAPGTNRFKLELGRAQRLFDSQRYTLAREAFARLKDVAEGDDLELVGLRLAEADYFLKRTRVASDSLKNYIQEGPRQGEALFFYASALYDLSERDEYFRIVRRLADEFPAETWSEEALNHLATHYIVSDDDVKADETFREMFEKFPLGRHAERAAWKIGWLSYRNRQFEETIRVFERGAATFPRSDYRPAWLYWSARSYEALNDVERASARHAIVATDYYNSYYGRLSRSRLNTRISQALDVDDEDTSGESLPPNQELVRALLGVGLYDQAAKELQYAQAVWGNSSAIQATLAWTYRRQGQAERGGSSQFTLYRSAINTMKRAYPHYLSVEGEQLPREVLQIIFPLAYWDLIKKHAATNGLDPYLVAALVAQESTFVRDIRSPARAVGLMQLLPSTARQMARGLKMRYSASLLTNPEASIRMGTAYLAQNIRSFGETHLVLASYNAGPLQVRRWQAERAGLPRDEFIDDIPFPETQNYVKRILGTAEDYRRLYGQ